MANLAAPLAIDSRFVTLLLSRFGNGPVPSDYKSVPEHGLNAWLEEQLSPPAGDDDDVKSRLADLKLHIKYNANADKKWAAMDEMRPLQYIDKPIEAAWALLDNTQPKDGQEKRRPVTEVAAATCLRAVYSKYQLREAVALFWHDHFNVNAYGDEHIGVAMPAYDRDVIRKYALGNFREMLEAVGTSAAMQFYLSNRSSRTGAPNENYARELFELHTIGRDAYLNDKYDRWRDVPGALTGNPVGYIDQDVYEAARAFTGWTIEDGAGLDGARKLPNTGKFVYVENWHDGYQKRVLGQDFDPFRPAMADGRKVYDLVANHPATGRHIVSKLCERFIGPGTSSAFIDQLTAEWQKQSKSPNQIAQIVSMIARSNEFANSHGNKVKRPLVLAASFARITEMDFTPTEGFINALGAAGQKLFAYGAPTGLPDSNEYFLGTNAMRNRWNLLIGMAQGYWDTGVCDPSKIIARAGENTDAANYIKQWLIVFDGPQESPVITSIAGAMGLVPTVDVTGLDAKRLASGVAIAAMSPNYQSS